MPALSHIQVPTVEDVDDEHVRRHQLILIEALVSRGCSESEIVAALADEDRR